MKQIAIFLIFDLAIIPMVAFSLGDISGKVDGYITEYELNVDGSIPLDSIDTMVISILRTSMPSENISKMYLYRYLPHLRKDTISIFYYRKACQQTYSMGSELTGQNVVHPESEGMVEPVRYCTGLSYMSSEKTNAYAVKRKVFNKRASEERAVVAMEVYIDDYEIKGVKWFVIE